MLVIHKVLSDTTLTLQVNGLMDYSTVDRFTPELPDRITKIIVDFNRLEFIDSTGIGAVLSLLFEANDRSVSVEFQGLSEAVADLFDTIGVFQINKTLLEGGAE